MNYWVTSVSRDRGSTLLEGHCQPLRGFTLRPSCSTILEFVEDGAACNRCFVHSRWGDTTQIRSLGWRIYMLPAARAKNYKASISKCQVLAGSACLQARAVTWKRAASRASHLPAFLIYNLSAMCRILHCYIYCYTAIHCWFHSCSNNGFYHLAKVCRGSRWNSAQRTSLFDILTRRCDGLKTDTQQVNYVMALLDEGWVVSGNISSQPMCLDVHDASCL